MSNLKISPFVLTWFTVCGYHATIRVQEEEQSQSYNGSLQNTSTTIRMGFTVDPFLKKEMLEYVNSSIGTSSIRQREYPGDGLQHNQTVRKTELKMEVLNRTDNKEGIFHNNLNGTLNDSNSENVGFFTPLKDRAREDAFNVTSPRDSPYSVLLLSMAGDKKALLGLCTGSLLTVEWVLSAAHCITNKAPKITGVVVYAGGYSFQEVIEEKPAPGSQTLKSSEFYRHPKYDSDGGDYDISVIKTSKKFRLTDTVNTVKLTARPWTHHSYSECKFTGFGRVRIDEKSKQDAVRKTHRLAVKKPCLCSFRMKIVFGPSAAPRYICTRPETDVGVCSGDSGGGLLCEGVVKGVAMQLVQLENTKTCDVERIGRIQCGTSNTFSIFQDVCPFVRWVNSYVRLFNDSEISPDCVEPKGSCGCIKFSLGVLIGLLATQFYLSYCTRY